MINLNNISKIYDNGVKALDSVNLSFDKKELVFITGESGNGKSTLLNIIGCLDKATSGNLVINGRDISLLDGNDISNISASYFGFVFQEFYLDNNLSVIENIRMPLEKSHNDPVDLFRLAEDLGISDILERKPNELSGGQRQRVQIARALLKNPEVILADEPTGNLDERIKDEIYKIFQRISKDHLVIIVSHDLEAAKTYADRIIDLKDGKIVSDKEVTKSTYIVNNIKMKPSELLNYISENTNKEINLNITKIEEKTSHEELSLVDINDSKTISSKFVHIYTNRLIKNNKQTFIFNIIILSILLTFSMLLLFFTSYDYKKSINKYLDKNFYNYYVLYNNVSYTNEFYEDFSNNLYAGKKMYNDLVSSDLDVSPLIYSEIQKSNSTVSTYIMYDNTLDTNSIEVSDYFAVKNNLKVNDKISFNNKEYKISNIFETDYKNYIDIIYSTDSRLSNVKTNIYHNINFVKLNYSNLKSDSLNIPFSNFTQTSFKKYSNTYTTINSSKSINKELNDNEIIVSKSFANRYNLSNESIGKTYQFIDIRNEKYNNYYDNYISLYDFYSNGFIVKDIVDDSNSDYFVSDNVFEKIIYEYDLYSRPSFYLVKNSENLKNINSYKFDEVNMSNIYIKGESFSNFRIYLNIIFVALIILISIYNVMYTSQLITKNIHSIGIFKSFGFENHDIKRIYNRYLLLSNLLIIIFGSLIYNLIYFIFENIQKDKMIYNQVIQDKYSLLVYIILIGFILLSSFIRFILYRKIDKEEPIVLMRA